MILEEFGQQTVELVPDEIFMKSPLELSQYKIENWQLKYYDEGKLGGFSDFSFDNLEFKNYKDNQNSGIKMEVTLKRILTNELLTTYLPSFFLIGICYATTFFKQFYFEAAVTVNLTVMLVATTLFIRFVSVVCRHFKI